MTDPRGVHSAHLDAETIAAFVDRTLDPVARAAAEAHLAACADCREVWVETNEIAGESEVSGWSATANAPAPRTPRVRSRRWVYGGAGLGLAAAAAILFAVVRVPSARPETAIEQTMAAFVNDVGTQRFTTARLSQPFAWGPPPAPQRGVDGSMLPLAAQRRTIELQEFAQSDRSARALHAAGIGLLAAGKLDDAILYLTDASKADPEYVAAHVDLGAALIERVRHEADNTEAVNALDALRRALEMAPESASARFNYALALESVGLKTQAADAWKSYLALDGDSAWSAEARDRLRALEGGASESDQSHSRIYDDIERRQLPAWASAIRENRAPPALMTQAPPHGFDPWLARLVLAAQTRPSTCLAAAIQATAAWQTAFDSGNSEASLSAAERALDGFRCSALPDTDSQSRRAVALLELGRSDEADLTAAMVTRAPRDAFPRSHARALQIRGLVAFQRGHFAAATTHLAEAVAAAEQGRDLEFAVALRTLMASLYDEQGDLRSSWQEARHAIAQVHEIESRRRRYAILATAAIRAQSFGLEGAALTFSDAVLETTADWDNPLGRAFALLQRAEAYDRLGKESLARKDVDAARELLPRIESEAVRRDLAIRLQMSEGIIEPDPARAIPLLSDALKGLEQTSSPAFHASVLLARGRAFNAIGQTANAAQDWHRGVSGIEGQWSEIKDPALRISRQDRIWDLYEELIRHHRGSPLASLEIAERGRARQLLETVAGRSAVRPSEGPLLFKQLPPRTEAVVYASLANELFVWHVTPRGVLLETHPVGRERLSTMVDEYRSTLQRGDAPPTDLRRVLFPTSLELSEIDTLLIAPDGGLHRFPFNAFQTGPDQPYLVERVTPVIIASLSTAAHVARPLPTSSGKVVLVGVGAPPQSARLPLLAGVPLEMTAIGALYPAAQILQNEAATPESVGVAIRTAGIFHFAGHALVEPRFPDRSRLVLANGPNGYEMNAGQVSAVSLPRGATVILGACETATGAISRSEGAAALSRSFLAAGASFVVGTIWPVNDREASSLLIELHRSLSGGADASTSLTNAQRIAIKRGEPEKAWAGFQLLGGIPSKERSD